jgi:hypothetical protein
MSADWKTQRDKYLTDRVQDQIGWYNQKSNTNKLGFYWCRSLVIFSGALIPLLVGYANGAMDWLKYVAGFLGVVVAVSEGMLSLRKYRENWSIYRLSAERLTRERLLYDNQVGDDYAAGDEAAFRQFVYRAEQIMASENEDWKTYLQQPNAQ